MTCTANIIMLVGAERRTVTLEVEFSVYGGEIDMIEATVIDVDTDDVTPELLAMVQDLYDANEDEYVDQVEEECIDRLEIMGDGREP